jgi:hypothetical protein
LGDGSHADRESEQPSGGPGARQKSSLLPAVDEDAAVSAEEQ